MKRILTLSLTLMYCGFAISSDNSYINCLANTVDYQTFKTLFESGKIDLNEPIGNMSVLEAAICYKKNIEASEKIVKLLLENGADPNGISYATKAPFIAKELYDNNKDIIINILKLFLDSPKFKSHNQLIAAASKNSNIKSVQLLLTYEKCKPTINDRYADQTALMHAARNGNEELTKLLLDAGADTSIKSLFPPVSTALNIAERYKHTKIASLLKKHMLESESTKKEYASILDDYNKTKNDIFYFLAKRHPEVLKEYNKIKENSSSSFVDKYHPNFKTLFESLNSSSSSSSSSSTATMSQPSSSSSDNSDNKTQK